MIVLGSMDGQQYYTIIWVVDGAMYGAVFGAEGGGCLKKYFFVH